MKTTQRSPFAVGVEVYELSRAMRRYFDRRARSLGFAKEQWRALWHLHLNEGITQAGLAEILEIQPISLARTLERMVAAGLIDRRPDPKDRRALKLFLTVEAEPLIAVLSEIVEEFRVVASEGLSAAQQSQVVALLRHMRINLDNKDGVATPTDTVANG